MKEGHVSCSARRACRGTHVLSTLAVAIAAMLAIAPAAQAEECVVESGTQTSTATGYQAFACGIENEASGDEAVAMGAHNIASGADSVAVGTSN